MKVLRVTFHRKVEQKAIHDLNLSDEDCEKLKTGELQPEDIVKNNIGEDFSYSSVGWIETAAEQPKLDFEMGLWTSE